MVTLLCPSGSSSQLNHRDAFSATGEAVPSSMTTGKVPRIRSHASPTRRRMGRGNPPANVRKTATEVAKEELCKLKEDIAKEI